MPVVAVVGAQWGDEGKGKVVDLYAQKADVVVRYGGGANAGHTLVVDGKTTVLHLVPSGALHPNTTCLIGPGCVVDPKLLLAELTSLREHGPVRDPKIFCSDRAFLVLPHHMLVDGARDKARRIGTTKRGIGPAYQDKVCRRGLRLGDLLRPRLFRERLEANLNAWQPVANAYGAQLPSVDEVADPYLALAEPLASAIVDTSAMLQSALRDGRRVLLEGAQGTMLDLDHGTYPYVTSSTVTAGGACTGAGLGPTQIDGVIGIAKAYTTRVGNGPFPTELLGAEGDALREAGNEVGATTGRDRRCGWLDLPVLRHAAQVNGFRELAITKLDVLSGRKTLKVCTHYLVNGEKLETAQPEWLDEVEPVYQEVPGWSEDLSSVSRVEDLPKAARDYLDMIASLTDCPVGLISVGADRAATLDFDDPFDTN